MKEILIEVCILITLFVLASYCVGTSKYKDLLGKTVVINADTLTVVDYDIVHSTVILDNDQILHIDLVKTVMVE